MEVRTTPLSTLGAKPKRVLFLNEQSWNVIENKGPLWKTGRRSRNVRENKRVNLRHGKRGMAARDNLSRPPPWTAAAELAKLPPLNLVCRRLRTIASIAGPTSSCQGVESQEVEQSRSGGRGSSSFGPLDPRLLDYSTPRLSNT